MHAGTLARPSTVIADDPAHRIPRRYRHQLLAGLKRDIADAFGRGIKAIERAFGPGIDLHRIDIARTDLLLCRRPVCGIDARGRWTGLRLYRWWRLKLTGQRQRHRRLDAQIGRAPV